MSEEEIEFEETEQAYDQVATDDSVDVGVADQQQSDKEINIARLRESKEESDRKAAEALREAESAKEYAKRLEEMIKSKDSPKQEVIQEETDDYGDAIDSEYFQKINARMNAKEKEWTKKLAEQEARFEDLKLKESDGNYIETINKYLPSVVNEDPDVKDIIRLAPKEKQMRIMLKFAKSNPQYILDKHAPSAESASSKIEENLSKTQTMGALASTSKSAVKANDVWSMDSQQFDHYLQKLTRV